MTILLISLAFSFDKTYRNSSDISDSEKVEIFFDNFFDKHMQEDNIPGLAVTIIKGEDIVIEGLWIL